MSPPNRAFEKCKPRGLFSEFYGNSETVDPKDLRLGQIVYILVFYNISFSWLLPLDGFQFNFLLRDSENDLYTIKFFFVLIKISVVAKSSLLPLWLLLLLKCRVA